jgi:ribonuclease HI
MNPEVIIYVDGACDNKYVGSGSNQGAWCCIIVFNGKEKIVTGTESDTTNQRMEIAGLVTCLPHILRNGLKNITVVTDSMYVVYGINNRKSWARKRMRGKKIPNDDLWEPIHKLLLDNNPHIKIEWVRGHNGHPFNERCDKIANSLL